MGRKEMKTSRKARRVALDGQGATRVDPRIKLVIPLSKHCDGEELYAMAVL